MRQNYIIKEEFNRMEFLDSRFYETDKGERFPSVTTILDAYPKGPEFYEWLKKQGHDADDILEEAGRLGDTVHKLTEAYDRGEAVTALDENRRPKYKTKDWAMFERYVDFSKRYSPTITHSELNLCSSRLKFGGTLDRRIILGGQKLLLDIKTGNYIWNHMWLQLAAYDKLFSEFYPDDKVDGIAILHLNAKTRTDGKGDAIQGKGWKLERAPKSTGYYYDLFEATRRLWLEEHGDMVPKEISYQLVHQKETLKSEIKYTKATPESYDAPPLTALLTDEVGQWVQPEDPDAATKFAAQQILTFQKPKKNK